LTGNRFFTSTKIRGGSLKPPGFIAVNQQVMDNQTLCQQITQPINNISNHKLLKNHCKTTRQSMSQKL